MHGLPACEEPTLLGSTASLPDVLHCCMQHCCQLVGFCQRQLWRNLPFDFKCVVLPAVPQVEEILSLAREMGATCVHALKMDATRAVLPPSASNGINATSSGAPITASDGGPAEAAMEQREAAMEQRQAGGRVAEAAAAPPSDPQPAAAAPPAKASSASTSGAAEPVPAGAAPIPAAAASTAAVPGPGLSLKLQQRTQRRLNSMAARGITPPPSELRKAGLLAGPTCAGFEAESFDFILLDAPCTATGLRPRLVQPLTLAAVRQTEHYQRQLLGAAVRLLKQGGFLVYSTCSINPGVVRVKVGGIKVG